MASVVGEVANLGLTAASGGAFGLVGTLLGRVGAYFERKQAFKQEQARWQNDRQVEAHEIELLNLEERNRANEAEREIQIIQSEGSWQGLGQSLKAQTALVSHKGGSPWVIDALRLVRPVVTLMLWIIVGIIFGYTKDGRIIEAAVFAATCSTLWWFGDRAPKAPAAFMNEAGYLKGSGQ